MTTINPSNYTGINATVVGYVAADPRPPAYDKDDERGIREIPIPIGHGYKNKEGEWVETSTTWVTFVTAAEAAEDLESRVRKGDKVRIDNARMETRQYTDRNGDAKIGVEIRFGDLTVLESNSDSWGDDDDSGAPF